MCALQDDGDTEEHMLWQAGAAGERAANAFRREGVVVYIGLCNTIIAHKSYANNTLHHISNIEVFIIATIIFNYFFAQ
ncbi:MULTISPECIES: hypothetical protein [unclassified Peribacillus]|uniref:hypothetical protein n=1 Tax=unclassified Peribacillus TaxID=2675266 RepID=UPI0036712EE1